MCVCALHPRLQAHPESLALNVFVKNSQLLSFVEEECVSGQVAMFKMRSPCCSKWREADDPPQVTCAVWAASFNVWRVSSEQNIYVMLFGGSRAAAAVKSASSVRPAAGGGTKT